MGGEIEDHLKANVRFQLTNGTPINAAEAFILGNKFSPPQPTSPSEWFAAEFPDVAKQWGPAFLEITYSSPSQPDRVRPVSMSLEFFVGVLSGQKAFGHDVIYDQSAGIFYFRDFDGCYTPTSEERLKTVLSQHLLRCAQSLQKNVDFEHLFNRFRSDDQLDAVIKKAKALLAVRADFFFGTQGQRRRINGKIVEPELESPHEIFIQQQVIPAPDGVLLLREFWNYFEQFCDFKGVPKTSRKHLRKEAASMIKEKFGVALRKDLKDEQGRWLTGWKNLSLIPIQTGGNRAELPLQQHLMSDAALMVR